MMKLELRKIVLALCLAAPVSMLAKTELGDTTAQVLKENGLPLSKLGSGNMQILRYRDQTIKLEGGIVISIQTVTSQAAPANEPERAASAPAVKAPVAPRVLPTATDSALVWQTNFANAVAQAKTDNRKVLLFFTGSDWCGWCMRLNSEVLLTPEFARYSKDQLILVELDFPRSRPQSAALKTQNAKLAQRFHIKGYPTVIILDSNGTKIDQLGYQQGGPGPFISRLSKL